jgi:hypothetical protein
MMIVLVIVPIQLGLCNSPTGNVWILLWPLEYGMAREKDKAGKIVGHLSGFKRAPLSVVMDSWLLYIT